ncbi:MAG: CBS domain-containing protein [Balneolaceae bacterium]|nr:CBS domain-containing protein [Balneolaceae bacterium]
MVKSYQGAQKQPPKYKEQALQVKDFMAKKLITFSPDDSMHHVTRTLVSKGISGAPVVDEKGNLIGVISEGDCLKQVVRGKYTNSPQLIGKVSDFMTPDPVTIGPGENILQVAQMFLKLRLRRFPVLDNGKLVGQISQRDVMAAIDDLKNETW